MHEELENFLLASDLPSPFPHKPLETLFQSILEYLAPFFSVSTNQIPTPTLGFSNYNWTRPDQNKVALDFQDSKIVGNIGHEAAHLLYSIANPAVAEEYFNNPKALILEETVASLSEKVVQRRSIDSYSTIIIEAQIRKFIDERRWELPNFLFSPPVEFFAELETSIGRVMSRNCDRAAAHLFKFGEEYLPRLVKCDLDDAQILLCDTGFKKQFYPPRHDAKFSIPFLKVNQIWKYFTTSISV